jgi:glutathione S-transferase
MKIELFHSVSARSFRPLWVLEELGLPYTLLMVPFPPRALHRAYLETNPLGTVPALRVGDTLMTESVAIAHYLASLKSGEDAMAVAPAEPDHAAYLNFLFYGEATLTFPQTLVLRYRHFEAPEKQNPQIAQDYERWFLARLRTLDAHLEDRRFLCADRFTVADVSVGYALMLAEHLGLLPALPERIQAYWRALQSRPSFHRALQVERDAAIAQGVSPRPAPSERPWADHAAPDTEASGQLPVQAALGQADHPTEAKS